MKIGTNLFIAHLTNYLRCSAILRVNLLLLRRFIELLVLKQCLERANAPFTHVGHRLGDGLHVPFLLLVGLTLIVCCVCCNKVFKERCECGVSNMVRVVCLVYDGQLLDDCWHPFANYGCEALEGPSSQLLFGKKFCDFARAAFEESDFIPID